jgi:putative hemolysin
MTDEILILLALVLCNGVLAGAEIAVVTLRPTRLAELEAQKRRGAGAVHRLRRDPERFLATVQVGITVIGALAGVFSGSALARDLAPILARVPALAGVAEQLALFLVVSLLAFLSIVLGELVPKSLALRSPEGFALLMARPLSILATVAHPFVWFLTATSNAVLRPFRDHTTFSETRLSKDEIHQLMEEASQAGTVTPHVGAIASRAIDFGSLVASDVMVHRRFVAGLPLAATEAEVLQAFLTQIHRRLPVYDGTLDNVVGYVALRDVFRQHAERKPVRVQELMRPLHFVPETRRAADLLSEMQTRGIHILAVVEEHGGLAGIVTMEDLVEELVGEIQNEHDAPGSGPIRREGEHAAVVQGTVPVREVNTVLGLDLPVPEGGSTISWLCVTLANARIPVRGERFTLPDQTVLEVLESSARRVRQVRVLRAPATAPRA